MNALGLPAPKTLDTTPVTGPGVVAPPAAGMVTVRPVFLTPYPLYRVDVPVPLLAVQKGLLPNPLPHGFLRLASWWSAMFGRSETRLCTRKLFPGCAVREAARAPARR